MVLNPLRVPAVRLITLRWLALAVAAAPAALVAWSVTDRLARETWIALEPPHLPVAKFVHLLTGLGPAWGAAAAGALLAVLFDQFLLVGAVRLAAYERGERVAVSGAAAAPHGSPRLVRWVWADGGAHLLRALRAVLFGLLVLALGYGLLAAVNAPLSRHGERAGWTGYALGTKLGVAMALLGTLWLALVGAWVLWARTILVMDGRFRVRRVMLLALRAAGRDRFRRVGLYVVATLAGQLASGAVTWWWLQHPATSAAGLVARVALWTVVSVGQAALWFALVRVTADGYARVECNDLRDRPDAGPGVIRRAWAWWRYRGMIGPVM